jgi:hypothetical protein
MADSTARDAYWSATQAELKSIQRRGDAITLLSVAVACSLLILFRGALEQVTTWNVLWVTLPLAVISMSVWFVARRRRQIAVARGLICARCEYRPHDTEIMEVAQTRCCPRCATSLDR